MLGLALDVARESDCLVVPTVGAALEAAGYDTDFGRLRDDGRAPRTAPVGDWRAVRLIGRRVFFLAMRGARFWRVEDCPGTASWLEIHELAPAE